MFSIVKVDRERLRPHPCPHAGEGRGGEEEDVGKVAASCVRVSRRRFPQSLFIFARYILV